MNGDDLQRLEEAGSVAEIVAGHVLIERGQFGTGLFVILDGTVVVETPEGEVEFGPQSLIGERALLSTSGKRQARVRARSDLHVLAVDRHEFERLCNDDPAFARRLADAGA